MSDTNYEPKYIEYGSKPFLAILLSLFLAGFASFSSLYCVQPMMPIFAKFFAVFPTHSSFPLSFSTVTVAMTYIDEEITQQDIGFAMGLYISGTAIGGMGGRVIAGVLVDFISWQKATLIIGLLNLVIAVTFYKVLPTSKHFKPYPICFSRFKESFIKNVTNPKLRLLFAEGFILMRCFITVFNYMSYHLLEKPFELSQTWISLISITYVAGIYSSPRTARWGLSLGVTKSFLQY